MQPPEAGGGGVAALDERLRLGRLGRRTRDALMTYVGVVTVLAILVIFFSATQSQFFTYENFLNILDTNAVLLVISIGLTFTLLVGGFDLSIGGVLALSGVVLAKLLQNGVPTGVAVFARSPRSSRAIVSSSCVAASGSSRINPASRTVTRAAPSM